MIRITSKDWSAGPHSGTLKTLHPKISHRSLPGLEDGLPLLILPLNDELQLCFPAPALPTWCTGHSTTSQQSLHTHLAEGAALFWSALHQVPVEGWSTELHEAMKELDALLSLPPSIREHMRLS